MSKILLVEDEEKIARFVTLELEHEGYEVDHVNNGRAAVERALSGEYGLVLLDVMLPELNGMEVLRRVRKESKVPIIMLTARDAVMDKVAGLDAGADDYITKPFAIEELLARVRVVFKHASEVGEGDAQGAASADAAAAPATASYTFAGVTLDINRHEVTCQGTEIELTSREFKILQALMEHQGTVLGRERLAHEALGYDYVGETNVVDVHIAHLRSKIDDRFGLKLITTVRGVGYVIK